MSYENLSKQTGYKYQKGTVLRIKKSLNKGANSFSGIEFEANSAN